MDLVERVVKLLNRPAEETRDKSPEGVCPVCWGYQEYDSKIRKVLKDKQVDVNNHKASYLVVQDFVVRYIDGIRLKKGVVKECPTCGKNHNKDQDYKNNTE